jgi:hypothetical protein
VPLSRRLTPYLLLTTLTLGAGLGAGLGLSQGPILTGAGTFTFTTTIPQPPGTCVREVMEATVKTMPRTDTALERLVRRVFATCPAVRY